jgi:Uma2 family endonuclease
MSVGTLKRAGTKIGAESNGLVMTPQQFDRAEFEEWWRFELINGVLVVSPIPSEQEIDPNDQLGFLLRYYKRYHPKGSCLNLTLPEWTVRVGNNRRRPDRCIWAGLARHPKKNELPTIIVEFVSARKRDRDRDFKSKRVEYLRARIKEYWVIDRFDRCMVVFTRQFGRNKRHVVLENEIYTTPLLEGFELPLAELLTVVDVWAELADDADIEE